MLLPRFAQLHVNVPQGIPNATSLSTLFSIYYWFLFVAPDQYIYILYILYTFLSGNQQVVLMFPLFFMLCVHLPLLPFKYNLVSLLLRIVMMILFP